MKLTMKELNVDSWIAMFGWLALATGWELDAQGTIKQFH